MNIACTICLDRFFLSSTISASPCGHLFHDACLDRWLVDERKKTCPQCRTPITPKQILKKLYLMEPLCQTQMPAAGQDTSELMQRIDNQETKILESEQRCRKALTDLQKTEERRQAFEKDTVALRKQLNEQTTKYQKMIHDRDAKLNMLIEQYKHVDLSNKKDEQIKALQIKVAEYRNIEMVYKGTATQLKNELQSMKINCQTVQEKDRLLEELIRYNIILKEEHSKMSDDKQDLVRNLDRITAQCEKMQIDKRQAVQKKNEIVENTKQELKSLRQQVEIYKSRIEHLESQLNCPSSNQRNAEKNEFQRAKSTSARTTADDDNEENQFDQSNSDDDDDHDSNMVDLTNVVKNSSSNSSSPQRFSTQQFSNTSSAIDILHSIIQETAIDVDLPKINKQKVRRLDDDVEDQEDYLVRPLVNKREQIQRNFNRFGGHSVPFTTRRLSSTNVFKSKLKTNKPRTNSTRNNHKITSFFA